MRNPDADGGKVLRHYMHNAAAQDAPWRLSAMPFMASQLAYLDGLDANCSTPTVHLLCTERLTYDWADLMHSLSSEIGSDTARVDTSARHGNFRSKRHCAACKLSEEDAKYVREVAYPWDAMLHAWACNRTAAP